MAAAPITCTRGEVATLVRRILSVSTGDGLQAWFAVTHWFKPRSVVFMARLMSPKRTKNVNELQVAVMQWELTLVEHESKFSEVEADSVKTAAMRVMLPKNVLERFLDGPFQYEELRSRASAYVGEKLAGQDANGGAQPMDIGRSTSPKERTKMSMLFNSAVRMIDAIRSTSKSPTTSENPSTVGLPTRHHQHHANRLHDGSDETIQSAGKKKRLIWYRCGGMGHPALLCPSRDDCQDVEEVGTEPSSDVDSDLFGLDWCDDPIATINSVTERNDRTRGGKELLAFVDSGAFDNVLPKSVCTEYTLEATSKSQSGPWF